MNHAAPLDGPGTNLLGPGRPVSPAAAAAFRFLEDLVRPGQKYELAKVRKLLSALGDPDRDSPWIQVVGTNGKGSVCAMLAATLGERHRVGFFSSPHLVSVRERIVVGREAIPVEDFVRCAGEVRAAIEGDATLSADPPSFFEACFAMACLHFREQRVGIAIAEAGLGGRLDATSVLNPVVHALTNVSYDHEKILGPTLEDILREKVAVASAGIPLISGLDAGPLADAARRHCDAAGAKYLPASIPTAVEVRPEATHFRLGSRALATNLAGGHQAKNAAVALGVLDQLPADLRPGDEDIARGLLQVRWPGRFQRLPGGIVIDGGHNQAGLEATIETFRALHGDQAGGLVIGFSGDKRIDEMIAILSRLHGPIVVTMSRHWRAAPAAELQGRIERLSTGRDVRVIADPEAAVRSALARRHGDAPLLVTGSLYLIGEIVASGVLGSVDDFLGLTLGPWA